MWQFKFLALVTPFGRKMGEMSRKLIWQRSHQGTMRDRTAAIAYYHQHIADVKASVPAEQLLVYSVDQGWRSEEHTSELQSLMRISYAVFCLKKKKNKIQLQ